MMNKTLLCCLGVALCLSCAAPAPASSPVAPVVIDHFVADLFPKASRYFWIVNAAQEEDTRRETIVDLNTVVTPADGAAPVETRFLLLIIDGKVFAAQAIPVNATVDCGKGEEV